MTSITMTIKQKLNDLGYIVLPILILGDANLKVISKQNPDIILIDTSSKDKIENIELVNQINSQLDIPVLYINNFFKGEFLKGSNKLESIIELALHKFEIEERLKAKEEVFSTILESLKDAIIITDQEGKITFVNNLALELISWEEEEAIDSLFFEVFKITIEDSDQLINNIIEKVFNQQRLVELEEDTTLITKDGTKHFITGYIAPIQEKNGAFVGGVIAFKDITDRMKREQELCQREQHYSNLFNKLSEGFALHEIICDEDGIPCNYRFLEVNSAFKRMTGLAGKKLVGETVLDLLPNIEGYLIDIYGKVALTEEPNRFEYYFERMNKYFEIVAFSPAKGQFATILIDITERKSIADKVEYFSFHDKLTGLYNRAYFEEELKRLDNQRFLPLSLIIGDVNGLKLVNDAFGHKEGDRLLKKIAQILDKSCRKEDIIARWGGDEFALILPRVDELSARKVMERIRRGCREAECSPIKPSIALGLITKELASSDVEELLLKAENKMYKNKLMESKRVKKSIILSLKQILWEDEYETKEHTYRLQKLALKMGEALELCESQLDELELLATLHDIGKVAIPDEILMKSDQLSIEERGIMKEHPEIGYRIAKSSPEVAHIAEAILSHHEHWDGTGYPQGIKGRKIPLIARIIAIVDAYDIMIYQRSSSQEEAIAELERCAGSQFDPELVDIFIAILEQ